MVELFDGVDNIFRASLTELEGAGLPALLRPRASRQVSRWNWLAKNKTGSRLSAGPLLGRIIQIFPGGLKKSTIPLVLYVRGNAEAINKYGLVVVGTSHPTPYGLGIAERLSCDLAARGLVIVSGMARGIDSAAHRGALSRTFAVAEVFRLFWADLYG